MLQRIYIIFILLSLLVALVLLIERSQIEQSSPHVQFVVDYEQIAAYAHNWNDPDGERWIRNRLREAKIESVAIHEATLLKLHRLGIVELLPTRGMHLHAQNNLPENSTLLLFPAELEQQEREYYIAHILDRLAPWTSQLTWQGQDGLLIELPLEQVEQHIVGFPLSLMTQLQQEGFQLVARVDSNKRWQQKQLDDYFSLLHRLQISTIIFEEGHIFSYSSEEEIENVAKLLQEYHFILGMIEFHEQKGMKQLILEQQLPMVRVFSLAAEQLKKEEQRKLEAMLSLAVQERNIRLLYLHLPLDDPFEMEEVLENTLDMLSNVQKTVQAKGYLLDEASPFQAGYWSWLASWRSIAQLALFLGSLAFISLFLQQIGRRLSYYPLPIGMSAYLLSLFSKTEHLFMSGLTLSMAIIAPVYALIFLDKQFKSLWARQLQGAPVWRTSASLAQALILFLGTTAITLYGAAMIAALLSDLQYIQYLQQFRGVKLLLLGPYILFIVYFVVKKWQENTTRQDQRASHTKYTEPQQKSRLSWRSPWKQWLGKPILLGHLLFGAIVLLSVAYYLSRSGNAGLTLPLEQELRHWLHSSLGVRPRTKEILMGHPALLLACYLGIKQIGTLFSEKQQSEENRVGSNEREPKEAEEPDRGRRNKEEDHGKRNMTILLFVGLIGQVSIISTFTHLHTPLLISIQRTISGLVGGIAIGTGLILMTYLFNRWWPKKHI